jgi:hypothetical protein
MGPTNFGITVWQRLRQSIVRWQTQKREIFQDLRVCLPGIVQAFYPATQTVDVQIATNEYVWLSNSPTGAPNPNSPTLPPPLNIQTQAPQLPLLQGIPVFIPNAGGLMLTFPVKAGDECDVVFHDTPIGGWWQNGGLNNLPFDQRRHNLSDGVAYIGPRSKPNAIPDYSTVSAQLRDLAGDTVIDVNPNGTVTITAATVIVNSTTATVNATGTVTISGGSVVIGNNVTISGHEWLLHQHTGVQSGSGISGGINPSGP